ncbi:type VI secretion protein [Streptomyces sp. NPDC097619]|uniref:type VI secretion protein n=1 Tax=Streptomyces sp. NPDC097619 TaxID=3157228 RepID=UPI0033190314
MTGVGARGAAPEGRERGIPDGLLLGLLAFVLGLAALVWTATGLSALFARGDWPDTVTFDRTPEAVRALIAQPHDLAGAWPQTEPAALSGWGLFWGLFLGELLILFVLTVFVIGVVARTKARRARARYAAREAAAAKAAAADPHLAARPAPPDPYGQQAPREAYGHAPAAVPAPGAHRPAPVPAVTLAAGPLPTPETVPPAPAPVALGTPEAGPATEPAAPSTALTAVPVPPSPTPFREDEAAPVSPGPWSTTPAALLRYAGPEERHRAAARRIAEAEGAALVVTSSPALWAETKDARAKLGPVLLYDPAHLCDTPARMHWHPGSGCEDRETAAARAVALLFPVRPQARIDAAVADTAETLLRSWLHAAALEDRPFKQVHRWAQGAGAHEPVRILRTHPGAAPGSAGELESALTAHPERREVARELTARALSALFSVHIREACAPNRTDSLTLASFLAEGGTLYVVGEPVEDPRTHPGAVPLLTALAADVVERGRRMAVRSSAGRLDPPAVLVLEDVAAVAPVPQLPRLLADPVLPVLALCRSREQARSRWPEADLPLA